MLTHGLIILHSHTGNTRCYYKTGLTLTLQCERHASLHNTGIICRNTHVVACVFTLNKIQLKTQLHN